MSPSKEDTRDADRSPELQKQKLIEEVMAPMKLQRELFKDDVAYHTYLQSFGELKGSVKMLATNNMTAFQTAEKLNSELGKLKSENDILVKKVSKYEAALFSRKRMEKAEKELNFGYEEKQYIDFMQAKFQEKNPREVAIKSFHYRIFQYFIHMVPEDLDERIKVLREKYGKNRDLAHSFCLDMKSTYKLLSEDIHDELILLADKKFNLREIIEDLKRLHLKPRQLKSIEDFLVIDGIELN